MNSLNLEGPVVVTGASGFIGANILRYFHERGFSVLGVKGTSRKNWRLRSFPEDKCVPVDLSSKKALQKFILDTGPSVIINCAAYGAYSVQTAADRIYSVNFEAVRNMFEVLHQVSHFRAFIQAGSSSEYGVNCCAPSEEGATIPESDYAVSKIAAAALTQFYGIKKGLPAWVFRLYAVYGPYEDPLRLIPTLLRNVKEGGWPPLVDPGISRDFIFVEDVARACEALLVAAPRLSKGGVYNVGTGKKTTMGDLVALVRNVFNVKAEPKWGSMANRNWDHKDWYSNPEKAQKDFSWQAQVSLEEGLKKMMLRMIENPGEVLEALQNAVGV